jgi:hypothetical protein
MFSQTAGAGCLGAAYVTSTLISLATQVPYWVLPWSAPCHASGRGTHDDPRDGYVDVRSRCARAVAQRAFITLGAGAGGEPDR